MVKNIIGIMFTACVLVIMFCLGNCVNKYRSENILLRERSEYFEKQYNDIAKYLLESKRHALVLTEQLRIATNETFIAKIVLGYTIEESGLIVDGIRGAIQLNNKNWRILATNIEYISGIQKRSGITN